MSKHTIRADFPCGISEVEVEISFDFSPGQPAVLYQRNGDPGWPAESAEIEFLSAAPIDQSVVLGSYMQRILDDWAADYLSDDQGHDLALDIALVDAEGSPW